MEVDFVIYGEIGCYAIEVKAAANIRSQDLRGLQEFKKDYPESTAIMLYGGKEKILVNRVLCIPTEKFLLDLKPWQNIIEENVGENNRVSQSS